MPRIRPSPRTLISLTTPRPGSGSSRLPSRSSGLVSSISPRLAIRLRGLQAFDGTLGVVLRQQFAALLQGRFGPVKGAQGTSEGCGLDTSGTGAANGLACT